MKITTGIKLNTQQTSPTKTGQGGWEDILPGLGGLIGSLVQPEGFVPGALTSGAGGAIGETARQGVRAFTGQGFDPSQILRSGGEQAAYGAIPGGKELEALKDVPQLARFVGPIAEKGLAGMATRTAARAGTGFLGGAAAQGIANLGQQQPQGDQTATGLTVGAINALMPGLSKILAIPGAASKGLGKIAQSSAERALERKDIPGLNAIQRLFGKESLVTGAGKSAVHPDVQSVIDKYNIPIPPKGNISEFKPALDKASEDVEKQLKPILSSGNANYSQEVKPILENNAETFFGTTSLAKVPPQVKKIMLDTANLGTNPTLYELKNIQRAISKLPKSWSDPKDETDQFGINAYKELGDLIQKKLDNVSVPEYQNLIKQHRILVKARDNYQLLTKPGGTLPPELTSTSHAAERMGSGLSGARAAELGLRVLPLAIGGGAQFLGLPKGVKEALGTLAAGYGAAEFGPAVNPEKALQIAGKMQQAPTFQGQQIQRLLQQLGVRLPGLGGQ